MTSLMFFIPVLMACKTDEIQSCRVVQYLGFFDSESVCKLVAEAKLEETLPEDWFHGETWCISFSANSQINLTLEKNK